MPAEKRLSICMIEEDEDSSLNLMLSDFEDKSINNNASNYKFSL